MGGSKKTRKRKLVAAPLHSRKLESFDKTLKRLKKILIEEGDMHLSAWGVMRITNPGSLQGLVNSYCTEIDEFFEAFENCFNQKPTYLLEVFENMKRSLIQLDFESFQSKRHVFIEEVKRSYTSYPIDLVSSDSDDRSREEAPKEKTGEVQNESNAVSEDINEIRNVLIEYKKRISDLQNENSKLKQHMCDTQLESDMKHEEVMALNETLSIKNKDLNRMLETSAMENKRQLLEMTREAGQREINFEDFVRTSDLEAANMRDELRQMQEKYENKLKIQEKEKEKLQRTIKEERILKDNANVFYNEDIRNLQKNIKEADAIRKYLEESIERQKEKNCAQDKKLIKWNQLMELRQLQPDLFDASVLNVQYSIKLNQAGGSTQREVDEKRRKLTAESNILLNNIAIAKKRRFQR